MNEVIKDALIYRTVRLQEFYDKNHSFGRKNANKEEADLINWLHTIRFTYVKGNLSQERLGIFEEYGQDVYNFIVRESQEERQNRLAHELMDYIRVNSKLPTVKVNRKLYAWLIGLRRSFRSNSLRSKTIEILDSVNPDILRSDNLKSLLASSLLENGDNTPFLCDIVGDSVKIKHLVVSLKKLNIVTVKNLVDTVHDVYSEFGESFQNIASMDCSELNAETANRVEAIRLISLLVTLVETEKLLDMFSWMCRANAKYNFSYASISGSVLNAVSELTGENVLDLLVSDADMNYVSQRMTDCLSGLKPRTRKCVIQNKYYGKSFKEIAKDIKSTSTSVRNMVLFTVTRFNRDIVRSFILTGDIKFSNKSLDDIVSCGIKRSTARLFRRDIGFIKRNIGKGNALCGV